MANLATMNHWSPQVMSEMSVEELLMWHEEARLRNESKNA